MNIAWLRDSLAGFLVKRLATALVALLLLQIGLFSVYLYAQTRDQFINDGVANAELGALIMGRTMDGAVDSSAVPIKDFWDTAYEEIPETDPKKFNTLYDAFLDNSIVRVEDQFLKNRNIAYAVLSDRNGYVPSHHSRYSPALTGDKVKDRLNLTKQYWADPRVKEACAKDAPSRLVTHDPYTGESIMHFVQPVTLKGKQWGAFHVGLKVNNLWATAIGTAAVMALFMIVASFLTLLVAAWVTRRGTASLGTLERAVERVAHGHLDVALEATSQERRTEIGRIVDAFGSMVGQMRAMIRQVKAAADTVASGTEQISSSSEQMAQTSKSQANSATAASAQVERIAGTIQEVAGNMGSLVRSVDETSSSISEVAASIQQVAGNADTLADAAYQTAEAIAEMVDKFQLVASNVERANAVSKQSASAAQDGRKAVAQTIDGMARINHTMREVVTVIEGLGKSSAEIGNIIEVIDDIAEQTNLLALNAAIEAARAGEHGRGFAVVADEVRKLAERSGKATSEIAELIKGIQHETRQAIQTTQEGDRAINEGTHLAEAAGASLNSIVTSVDQAGELLQAISAATEDQARSADRITMASAQMSTLSQQVKLAMHEQASASQHISRQVESMNRLSQQVSVATAQQKDSSGQMVREVEHISRSSTENAQAIEVIAQSTGYLQKECHALQSAVAFFKDGQAAVPAAPPVPERQLIGTGS